MAGCGIGIVIVAKFLGRGWGLASMNDGRRTTLDFLRVELEENVVYKIDFQRSCHPHTKALPLELM